MPDIEIRPLDRLHRLGAFSCGLQRIDNWFRDRAWKEQKKNIIRVFCATFPGEHDVVGYYSLTFIAWDYEKAKGVVATKYEQLEPLPTIYLPRIGVSEEHAHQGIGSQLLKDAFRKSAAIADLAAITALSLHAVDQEKAGWYESLGFVRLEPNGLEMAISMNLIRKTL